MISDDRQEAPEKGTGRLTLLATYDDVGDARRELGLVADEDRLRRSATRRSEDGTPAFRKYFCAMMSTATCDHEAGIVIPAASNTADPSGLTIRESRGANSMPAYGLRPAVVKWRAMRIGGSFVATAPVESLPRPLVVVPWSIPYILGLTAYPHTLLC